MGFGGGSSTPAANSITTAMLQAGAVTSSKIANSAIINALIAAGAVNTSTLATDVFQSARLIPPLRRTAGGTKTFVANTGCFNSVIIPRNMTIDQIICPIGSSSGNCHLGIYADNGDTPNGGALLADSGSIAVTGQATVATLATPLVMAQGIYWVCFMADNAVGTYIHANGIAEFNNVYDGCTYLAGGYALSNPCPAVAADTNSCPDLWLRVKSVNA